MSCSLRCSCAVDPFSGRTAVHLTTADASAAVGVGAVVHASSLFLFKTNFMVVMGVKELTGGARAGVGVSKM